MWNSCMNRMPNIVRSTWLRNHRTSVVGRRVCIGGGDHGYCFSHFRSHAHSFVPYKIDPKELYDEWEKEFLKGLSRDSPQYKKYMQNARKHIDDLHNKPKIIRYEHVRATQLLDLISVTLQSTTTNNTSHADGCEKEPKPFQIYGTIQLVDVDDNYTFNVFRRRCNAPQTVLPGSNLLLTVPEESRAYLIALMASGYKLRLNLKDAATDGKVIAKGDFFLQMLGDKIGFHENIVTKVVPGRNGISASVQYAILPHGVVATIQMKLTKINDTGSDQSESSDAHIYGCISATTKVQQGSVISSVLFDKPPCDPMMVSLGTPIELGRPKVAVPAYSFLQIKADLWDHHTNQQIASDVILANFQAHDDNWTENECFLLGHNYRIHVQVCWNNAYELIEKRENTLDELQSSCDQQSASSALSCRGIQLSDGVLEPITGSPMVEVFSITVSPDSDVNSDVCGTVKLYDCRSFGGLGNPFFLFAKDASNPLSLSGDMKIKSSSMKWPVSPFKVETFWIHLHLSDDEGREVCHGSIEWDPFSANRYVCWYGKLISSVVRGKHGYATVHYAMFSNAVRAEVHASFGPDPFTEYQCMIAGNISAWYSSIKYPTCSEKRFFRTTLLSNDHPTIVSGSCPLRLDRKSVAVPLNSSLVLGLQFEVGIIGKTSEGLWFSKHYGSMDQVVDFEVDVAGGRTEKTIAGDGFNIEVCIKWIEDDDKYEKREHYQSLADDLKRRFDEA